MTAVAIAGVLVAGALLMHHYRTRVARPPELLFRETPLLAHLFSRCPALRAP
jgi:hypothetical protein